MWILFQERWQDGASDDRACNKVPVGGAIALCIALCALSISTEIISRLLNPRNDPIHSERDRIHCRLPGKLELLLGGERNCIVDVADIEIWNEAEHTLLLLILDLILSHFAPSGYDPHLSASGSHT